MAADTKAPATGDTKANTPTQVCEALAKAAMDNNFKAFTDLAAMPMMGHDGKGCHMDGKECTDKNCPNHKKGKGKGKGTEDMQGSCEMHGMMGMHGMNMEEGFKNMHEKEMARLKNINCKGEKIAGDHAWVEATSENESRLVPFKMVDGKWKFDMRTYHSFYHPSQESMMMKK